MDLRYVFATLIVIGGGVLLLISSDPEPRVYDLQPSQTADAEKADTAAAIIVTSEAADSQSVVKAAEHNSVEGMAVQRHPKFAQYLEKTPHQVLIGLVKDVELRDTKIELLLQLIESGHIGINEKMRPGEGDYYTPIFAALVATRNRISKQELERFISLGASIDASKAYRHTLDTLRTNDIRVQQRWMEVSGIGPEHHQELFQQSVVSGDGTLARHLYQVNNGQLTLSERDVNLAMRRMALATQENSDLSHYTAMKPGRAHPLEFIDVAIIRVEDSLGKTQHLEHVTSLSPEQQQQVSEYRAQLLIKHPQLLEIQKQLYDAL